ncbi:MAG: type III pantothenate kinase [Bacteroidetes bacterium]|nr:type III pantothenate kinase [Bacteroidota bacterium]
MPSALNLCIDIGNSRTKFGIFKGSRLIKMSVKKKVSLEGWRSLLRRNKPIRNVILSSVAHHPRNLEKIFASRCHFIRMTGLTRVPVKIKYQTPHTLGTDRIAAVVGASAHFPGKSLLVINAGTCITFDFVSDDQKYFGGSIHPGLAMRTASLYVFTEKLPLIESIQEPVPLTGRSTKGSIRAGIFHGAISEISGIIVNYLKNHPGLIIVMTGGDLPFLFKGVKKAFSSKIPIFARPGLVLNGLNIILNCNFPGKF